MRSAIKPAALATFAVAASLQVNAAAPSSPQGIITAREFLDIGGTALGDLTNNAKFPNSPDVNAYSARFEWPTGPDDATPPAGDVKNNYGVQVLGYFYPPTTGDYVFYLAADDNAALYLSTDDNPANKKEIATEPEWNPVRAFGSTSRRDNHLRPDGTLPHISAPVRLTQGKAYYIEALMKEGGGGDNVAVAVQGPGDAAPEDGSLPIPGSRLSTFDRADLAPPYVAGFTAGPSSVTWTIEDGTGTPVDPNTVKVQVDGTDRTAAVSKSGKTTTAKVSVSPFFAAGSSHTSKVTAGALTADKSFTVANYTTVKPSWKVSADTTKPGFSVLVHQVSTGQPNTVQRAEDQLAGLLKDTDGNPLPNIADLSGAGPDGRFVVTDVINFDQGGGSNGAFTPDEQMPGIPGTEGGTDNIAMEIITYIQLPAGEVTMGVNSDDGFKTTAGNYRDVLASANLGVFDGGRGASDTIFSFVVEEAGTYPFRTIWFEGGGGANIEWFTVNGGTKVLVNGTEAGAAKSYRAVTGATTAATVVSKVVPAVGAAAVDPATPIVAEITEGATAVDTASVKLNLDGADVNATVTRSGKVVTARYQPPTPFAQLSTHTVKLSFTHGGTARSDSWSFKIPRLTEDKVAKLPGFLTGAAKYTEDKGGRTGKAGDYGMDLGRAGSSVLVEKIDFLNAAAADDKLTFAGWQKRYDVSNGSMFWANSTSSSGSTRGFQAHAPWGDGTLYFDTAGCCDGGTQRINKNITEFPGYSGSADWWNSWHHFAFVKNGSIKQIYIDGQLFHEGENTSPLPTDFFSLVIGGGPGVTENLSHAVLDEFVVYDGALSGADVQKLFGGAAPNTVAGLKAHWDFNDASAPSGEAPKFTSIKISGSNVIVEWTGTGTVQAADSVTGPWTDVPGATSPATVPITGAGKFWRIKQ